MANRRQQSALTKDAERQTRGLNRFDLKTNAELITTLSAKLEALIKTEIGVDDGREMPDVATVTWTVDRADL